MGSDFGDSFFFGEQFRRFSVLSSPVSGEKVHTLYQQGRQAGVFAGHPDAFQIAAAFCILLGV
jgi:hypothetical protein